MADTTETTEISASPAAVWAVLADFGEIARWAPNVDHSSLMTDQGSRVGATRRVQVGRNVLLEEVVRWEPEVALAYELRGLPPVLHSVINEWTLGARGSSTIVSLTTRIETGPRPPHKVVARVVGRMLGRAAVDLVGGLSSEVAARAAASENQEVPA